MVYVSSTKTTVSVTSLPTSLRDASKVRVILFKPNHAGLLLLSSMF
ncbi:hypothetical protein C5167_006949 [Papaver somniferum]|uniref:Uncharacterized protein n=1 Tax=Papaver somniferum TaxID=3469 RepID=A0A4Y7JHW3_PAPSO|nr:hypothetical protein C5167_006949 [Papaver somniferum]